MESDEVPTTESNALPIERSLSLLELEIRANACRRLANTLMAAEARLDMRAIAGGLELRAELLRQGGLSREEGPA
jgi:hypothetical protein